MSTDAAPGRTEFRLDINGLRALAVVAVLGFHFGLPFSGGGFAGVDIFFVISGFLMTRIILGAMARQRYSLWDFYLSRVRRIVPALLVVCTVLPVIGWRLLAPDDYARLGKHVVASLAFLSNLAYLGESGYFAPEAHDNWLLHTWSLSVEWQFYMVYPLLLMAAVRWLGPRRLPVVLLVVAGASLACSVVLARAWPEAGYFTLQSRGWELLAGALVSLAPVREGHRTSRALELAGLGLMAASLVAFDNHMPWPGWRALVPVAGTCLVLLANRGQASALRSRPLQFTGRISYSLYLWHWPVAVMLASYGLGAGRVAQLGGVLLSIAIASLSYRFVEQRRWFGRSATRLVPTARAAMSVGIVGLAAFAVHASHGLESRLDAPTSLLLQAMRMPTVRNGWCFYSVDTMPDLRVGADGLGCTLGARDGATKVLLFGDSFAGQNEPFWDVLGARLSWNIRAVTTNWCSPGIGAAFGGPAHATRAKAQCAWNRAYLREHVAEYDTVIFSAAWRGLAEDHALQDALDAIAFAAGRVPRTIVMASPTSFDVNVLTRWSRMTMAGLPFRLADVPREMDRLTVDADAQVERFTRRYPNVLFLDRQTLYGREEVAATGVPYSLDGYHISILGALAAADLFVHKPAFDALASPPLVPIAQSADR